MKNSARSPPGVFRPRRSRITLLRTFSPLPRARDVNKKPAWILHEENTKRASRVVRYVLSVSQGGGEGEKKERNIHLAALGRTRWTIRVITVRDVRKKWKHATRRAKVKNPARRNARRKRVKKKKREKGGKIDDTSTETINFNLLVITGRWLITARREGRKNVGDGWASRL